MYYFFFFFASSLTSSTFMFILLPFNVIQSDWYQMWNINSYIHGLFFQWIILSKNCTVNLVQHILHRWLEIVISPISFLRPRNYITILINTKSFKIFWLVVWTRHAFTYWLIIHNIVKNIIINTTYFLGKSTTLNSYLHLSAMFMIFTNTVYSRWMYR